MSKAVLYLRVSTLDQVENFSLATQERVCRAFCEREGFEVDRVFREEGESAKTAKRTELQAMLQYCGVEAKSRGITALVVHRVDRFARSVQDHVAIKAALKTCAVVLHSATEAFDQTPMGKFMETVMAAQAELDNDVRSARTKAGMQEGLSRGRWMWKAPLGYAKGDGQTVSLLPDPQVAPLVLLGFETMATGRSTRAEVLAELTSLGLVTRRGQPVTPQAFGKMLSNPLYMGRVVNEKWEVDVRGDFEPLVGADVFASVQEILRGRTSSKDSRTRDHPDFPLRRAVRCGPCTSPLTASWSRGRSGRYPYYHCPKKGCGGSNVRKERLEDLFLGQLESVTIRPEVFRLLAAVVEDAWKDRVRHALVAEKRLAERMRDLEVKRNRLVDAFLAGRGIDEETYENQTRRLDRDQREVRDRIEASRTPEIDFTQTVAFAQTLLSDLRGCWNRLDAEQKPRFVRALYPNGLTYLDDAIGTTQNPWWWGDFGAESDLGMAWAPPTGFEPVLPA